MIESIAIIVGVVIFLAVSCKIAKKMNNKDERD